ncbi:MAG: hypothetical protein CVV56_06590 [Tenericutes bacterium HGW-Tenericutes-1]|nr:MAG: hypothetical protein CVV56_06590 [Tenericutes bacterium HGW-Tenericutes-1]
MNKRLIIGLIAGAILGVVCIIGASLRSSEPLSSNYLFAFWYNRVIIGLAIGLLGKNSLKLYILKGVIIGTMVSFAFYSSTNYQDLMGFIAGVVYGTIIPVAIYLINDYKKTTIE